MLFGAAGSRFPRRGGWRRWVARGRTLGAVSLLWSREQGGALPCLGTFVALHDNERRRGEVASCAREMRARLRFGLTRFSEVLVTESRSVRKVWLAER